MAPQRPEDGFVRMPEHEFEDPPVDPLFELAGINDWMPTMVVSGFIS